MAATKKAKQVKPDPSSISHASPDFVRKVYAGLDESLRDRVNEILRGYRVACFRTGVEMENYGQVLKEAIHMAQLERDNPELREGEREEYTPFQKYGQYTSPVNGL